MARWERGPLGLSPVRSPWASHFVTSPLGVSFLAWKMEHLLNRIFFL